MDCETRLQTERRLSRGERDLFDNSQKRIEALMEKDPYRRFLRSSLYMKLKDCISKDSNDLGIPSSSTLLQRSSATTSACGRDADKSQEPQHQEANQARDILWWFQITLYYVDQSDIHSAKFPIKKPFQIQKNMFCSNIST